MDMWTDILIEMASSKDMNLVRKCWYYRSDPMFRAEKDNTLDSTESNSNNNNNDTNNNVRSISFSPESDQKILMSMKTKRVFDVVLPGIYSSSAEASSSITPKASLLEGQAFNSLDSTSSVAAANASGKGKCNTHFWVIFELLKYALLTRNEKYIEVAIRHVIVNTKRLAFPDIRAQMEMNTITVDVDLAVALCQNVFCLKTLYNRYFLYI